MGFFDKLKGAMNAVTGGAATVTLQYNPTLAFPGDMVQVRITATSTGQEVKSKGVFVDLRGTENVFLKNGKVPNVSFDIRVGSSSYDQAFQVAPPFVLAPGETKTFEGGFQIPHGLAPTYQGPCAQHLWEIRGRIEAFGNDPDSGFLPFAIGFRG